MTPTWSRHPEQAPVAALFDFDGVLVDSHQAHQQAWQQACREILGREPPPSFPAEHDSGASSDNVAGWLAHQAGSDHLAEDLAARKLWLLLHAASTPTPLPGAIGLLTRLHDHHLPCAIVSNAPRNFVRHTVRALALPVDCIIGLEDSPRPKPAPDPYLLGADRLGIASEDHPRTWVVEDSLLGIAAAVAAGMPVIGVQTSLSQPQLLSAGATLCCPDLRTAIDWPWPRR